MILFFKRMMALSWVRAVGGVIVSDPEEGTVGINLEHCSLGSGFIRKLAGIWDCVDLNLRATPVRDDDLEAIGSCRQLRSLDLSRTQVTDDGIPYLNNLPHLLWLSLCETKISDDAIRSLLLLPNLRCLAVYQTAITNEGLNRITQAFPLTTRIHSESDLYMD